MNKSSVSVKAMVRQHWAPMLCAQVWLAAWVLQPQAVREQSVLPSHAQHFREDGGGYRGESINFREMQCH